MTLPVSARPRNPFAITEQSLLYNLSQSTEYLLMLSQTFIAPYRRSSLCRLKSQNSKVMIGSA
jgi:hypothetical protein